MKFSDQVSKKRFHLASTVKTDAPPIPSHPQSKQIHRSKKSIVYGPGVMLTDYLFVKWVQTTEIIPILFIEW